MIIYILLVTNQTFYLEHTFFFCIFFFVYLYHHKKWNQYWHANPNTVKGKCKKYLKNC